MTLPMFVSVLPGPSGLPWLGNVLDLEFTQLPRVLEAWCRKYGSVYRVDMFGRRAVVIGAPELVQQILRERPETYRRISNIERALNSMGISGLFSVEGEAWRKQRRFVSRALDREHIAHFYPTLCRVTERLEKRWRAAARAGRSVDVQKDLMRYTVDLTAHLTFGYEMNTLENDRDALQQQLEQVLPTLHRRMNAPFAYWRYFKLPQDRAFESAMVQLRAVIGQITAHARRRLAQRDSDTGPRTLLEAMLLAERELSDHDVLSNVLTILLAGEDTTANTLAWALYYMCHEPGVQTQMQREADELCSSQLQNDLHASDECRYIESVIHETTRLKPATPLLFVEPNHDVAIDGLQIPRGTPIFLLTRAGSIEDGEFQAAREFQPSRWLTHSAAPAKHGPFMPFGAGPRLCPGRSLALLEMKIALAMISRHFTLRATREAGDVHERYEFVLTPRNLRVKFELR